MIDLEGRLHNLASADGIVSGVNRRVPLKSQSFAAELSGKLADTELAEPRRGVQQPTQLPASLPAGQQSVTWRDPGSGTSEPSGLSGLVTSYPSSTSETVAATKAPSQMSFDDAYWASQPAAVQQLQNIQDPVQKVQLATQLAQEGYSIDVPIMVWGWDPQIATQLRASQGYTWVPSALQQPVEVAPGLTFNGQSYNAAHPPAGSIAV